jgi:hypothetical protein
MANHAKGYITSSTVHKLLTGKSDKLLKGGRDFAKQIAMERFGVVDDESTFSGNGATQWGDKYEMEALARYEIETFSEVHSMQEGVEDGWLSCTPDGYVGKNGLTEVKCHYKSLKHMKNLLDNVWVKTYEEQCRFQMMLTERDWCDLISYDPRWPEPYDIHWTRIERDEDWEEFCMDRIEQAEQIIDKTLTRLKNLHKNTSNS